VGRVNGGLDVFGFWFFGLCFVIFIFCTQHARCRGDPSRRDTRQKRVCVGGYSKKGSRALVDEPTLSFSFLLRPTTLLYARPAPRPCLSFKGTTWNRHWAHRARPVGAGFGGRRSDLDWTPTSWTTRGVRRRRRPPPASSAAPRHQRAATILTALVGGCAGRGAACTARGARARAWPAPSRDVLASPLRQRRHAPPLRARSRLCSRTLAPAVPPGWCDGPTGARWWCQQRAAAAKAPAAAFRVRQTRVPSSRPRLTPSHLTLLNRATCVCRLFTGHRLRRALKRVF
jgi:hypothetical protein